MFVSFNDVIHVAPLGFIKCKEHSGFTNCCNTKDVCSFKRANSAVRENSNGGSGGRREDADTLACITCLAVWNTGTYNIIIMNI